MKKCIFTVLALTMLLSTAIPASATLFNIGTADYNGGTYNLIYDNDGGAFGSWMSLDYSLPPTDWNSQMNNVMMLNYSINNFHLNSGVTVNWMPWGWELARTEELNHLYYNELQNTAGGPLSNTGPFTSLIPIGYWGHDFIDWINPNPEHYDMSTGTYSYDSDASVAYAGLPRRYATVDIASSVPEPSTLFLLGAGISGLALYRRKSRK